MPDTDVAVCAVPAERSHVTPGAQRPAGLCPGGTLRVRVPASPVLPRPHAPVRPEAGLRSNAGARFPAALACWSEHGTEDRLNWSSGCFRGHGAQSQRLRKCVSRVLGAWLGNKIQEKMFKSALSGDNRKMQRVSLKGVRSLRNNIGHKTFGFSFCFKDKITDSYPGDLLQNLSSPTPWTPVTS